ncbi:MAG: acid phosphatase [Pseudomonadales bacterium]|nr:acid phosphatase [Pseudomonadales bacterium]
MLRQAYLSLVIYILTSQLGWAQSANTDTSASNNLLFAVAWKQTAAEYRALYHQAFNIARLQIETAIANRASGAGDKPLAVIADLDDTLLLSEPYWGYLVSEGIDFFNDEVWDEWIRDNLTVPSPGALAFLDYCSENNVEVFYVTNRDQGPDTYTLAMNNITSAGFPYADEDHLTVLRDTSNKQVIQDGIREEYDVVALLGDNLNDFSRRYYVTDVNQRSETMEEDSALFGSQYILFPNPTDGHWIRAIFGESEPAPTAENRETLKEAAMHKSWD